MLIVQDPKKPGVSAPQVVAWAPAVRPVAYVNVHVLRNAAGRRTALHFELLDPTGSRIPFDLKDLPQSRPTEAQIDAFLAEPTVAGDSLDASVSRRLIPLVETCFGLSVIVGELPPPVLAKTRQDTARVAREAFQKRLLARKQVQAAKAVAPAATPTTGGTAGP
jgi:hypothetical protein